MTNMDGLHCLQRRPEVRRASARVRLASGSSPDHVTNEEFQDANLVALDLRFKRLILVSPTFPIENGVNLKCRKPAS